MARWAEFLDTAGHLASLARTRIGGHALVLLGTRRRDGWPRISPVESLETDGDLLLGMTWQSRKALDLLRDPRCVIHSATTRMDGTEGDLKLYGRGVDVPEPARRERYAQALQAATGWQPDGPFHLFALDLTEVAWWQVVDEEPVSHLWRPPTGARRSERRSAVDLVRVERGESERRDLWRDRRGP